MDLRPKSPVAAMAALLVSMVCLLVSLNLVDAAQGWWPGRPDIMPADHARLVKGGLAFGLSLSAAIVGFVLWLVQAPRPIEMPDDLGSGALAPAIGLADSARHFVLRLHRHLLATGGLVLLGGLGLVAAASLVADGTPQGPFDLGSRDWSNWQVEVTTWSFTLLAFALAIWAREYAWARRLRAVWSEAAPEV